jgi:hypothetical protein
LALALPKHSQICVRKMNPMDMTDAEQDFWLGQLGKANRFNN